MTRATGCRAAGMSQGTTGLTCRVQVQMRGAMEACCIKCVRNGPPGGSYQTMSPTGGKWEYRALAPVQQSVWCGTVGPVQHSHVSEVHGISNSGFNIYNGLLIRMRPQ